MLLFEKMTDSVTTIKTLVVAVIGLSVRTLPNAHSATFDAMTGLPMTVVAYLCMYMRWQNFPSSQFLKACSSSNALRTLRQHEYGKTVIRATYTSMPL